MAGHSLKIYIVNKKSLTNIYKLICRNKDRIEVKIFWLSPCMKEKTQLVDVGGRFELKC